MNIYVIRNGQRFGPYTEQTLLSYVNQGQILVHDKAIRDTDTVEQTAGSVSYTHLTLPTNREV